MHDLITPVVLTFNEERNIARTLDRLRWARRVLIVDSGSTDATIELAKGFPNVRIVQRAFDNFAAQWTFGVTNDAVETPWVMALDADYLLTPELIDEISALRPEPQIDGFRIGFRYCIDGRPLHGTLYPPSIVLFRAHAVTFRMEGHTQRAYVAGAVAALRGRIHHDDRKDFPRWLDSQRRYAIAEAEHLLSSERSALGWADRIRRLGWVAPWLVPIYVLFGKGVVRDGWAGIRYTAERGLAECMIATEVARRRMTGGDR